MSKKKRKKYIVYPQMFIAVHYNRIFMQSNNVLIHVRNHLYETSDTAPYKQSPKNTAWNKEKREYVHEYSLEMCQLKLFQAILIEIKFYHRKMGMGHRVDIVHTALHMWRIPKQKLIKQYKDHHKILYSNTMNYCILRNAIKKEII